MIICRSRIVTFSRGSGGDGDGGGDNGENFTQRVKNSIEKALLSVEASNKGEGTSVDESPSSSHGGDIESKHKTYNNNVRRKAPISMSISTEDTQDTQYTQESSSNNNYDNHSMDSLQLPVSPLDSFSVSDGPHFVRELSLHCKCSIVYCSIVYNYTSINSYIYLSICCIFCIVTV